VPASERPLGGLEKPADKKLFSGCGTCPRFHAASTPFGLHVRVQSAGFCPPGRRVGLSSGPGFWHPNPVTLWLALRRLLPLLAVIGFALTPVAIPAATTGMRAFAAPSAHVHHRAMPDMDMGPDADGMAMDDMPCCPHEKAAKPDCGKGCPLMALCLATAVSLLPASVAVPVPGATRASPTWPGAAALASVRAPPLPEPPRA